jgi:hypothetical protein
LDCLTLRMKGLDSSKANICLPIDTASHCINLNLQQHHCENLKSGNELRMFRKQDSAPV